MKGMPSRGQNGCAMNDSFDQHSAQTPSPSTGSRQETHSVGSAMSSASLAVCAHTPRAAFSTPRQWVDTERGGDASASIDRRLALPDAMLKRSWQLPEQFAVFGQDRAGVATLNAFA